MCMSILLGVTNAGGCLEEKITSQFKLYLWFI